ncbi:MAG: hypothetical protein MI741_19465, partial [Rhodospirillales bacterium]|nr:hypothetical protein [Rhodospirillales bacterium]
MKQAMRLTFLLLILVAIPVRANDDFYAYHTGETRDDSQALKYADLIVVLGNRQLEFRRENSYHPQWRVADREHELLDLYPDRDEDPNCDYTYVRLLENGPDKIVVHWRYFPDLKTIRQADRRKKPLHPHGITGVVHELFTIYPDGKIEREVREAKHTRYQDWINPRLATRHTFRLTKTGIEDEQLDRAEKPPFYPRPAVEGRTVKPANQSPKPLFCWRFDDGIKSHEDYVIESVTGEACDITGLMTLYE